MFKDENYSVNRIIQLLENKTYSGKNIVAKCPFCGKDKKFSYTSDSNHSKYGIYHCFVCSEKGNGFELLNKLVKDQRRNSLEPRIPLNSFIEKERSIDDSKPKIFIDYGYWKYRFPVINQSGEEVYVKIIRYIKGGLNKKGKLEKDNKIIHKAEDGIYYWGMGKKDEIFYGINKIKKNSEIVFIVEGEKKRDRLEECLNNYYKGNDFSVISPTRGCLQDLDGETISALETANPKKIVLIPDLDSDKSKSFKFVVNNNSILLSKGFNSFIYNLRENILEDEPFDGYDIYDALDTHEEFTINNLINICSASEYLVLYQQRYLWDNRIGNKITFNSPYINQSFNFQFLYDQLKEYTSPCLFIKSIQGTGKTTLLKEIVEANHKLLYISSRRALCKEVAKLVEIRDYTWVKESEKNVENARENHSDSLAVCIDSIKKFDYILQHLNEYIVVFDEVDSTAKTLLLSKHILKPHNKNYIRPLYFGKFLNLIKYSKMSICMSSDIPESIINLIGKIKKQNTEDKGSNLIYHISNLFNDNKKYIKYYYFDIFISQIIKLLSNGYKVSISVNSKREINKLEHLILNGVKKREIKTLKICNIKTEEGLTAIKNKDFSAYDCVIYSPTIFTGNDFNIDFSDYHFMYSANNRTTDHYELLQSCFRFRRTKEIHYHFNPVKSKKDINSESIKEGILKKAKESSEFFTPVISSEENRLFIDTYCESLAELHKSRNDLNANFINLLKTRGANIDYLDLEIEKDNNFKDMTKNFRDLFNKRISELPIIANKNRLNSLINGSPALNEDEKDVVDKSRIYYLLDIPSDYSSNFVNKLVNKTSPRKTFERLLNNLALISDNNEIIEMDKSNQDNLLTDEPTKINLMKVLHKTFKVLFNLNPEELKPEKLRTIIPEVVIDAPKKAELGNLMKNDLDFLRFWRGKKGDVTYLIRNLFNDILGWEMDGKQGSNRKIPRTYTINKEGLNLFLNATCKYKSLSK